MYKLIFRGKDIDPLYLEDEKGKVLLDAYLQNKSVRLMAGGQAFSTSDIKSIFQIQKSKAETYQKPVEQENQYLEFRKKMLSLTLEQRSGILRFPKMIWKSITTDEMPQSIKDEIKKRQKSYFEENQNCIYANPKVYRDLMPLPHMVKKPDGMKSVQELLPLSMLRFIENAVHTDIIYATKK
jgi:hypothetical protein